MPASYIINIFQDSDGFLWVATYNGLSRFDGKEFINYGYSNGMPHLIADAIFEDAKHHLWIGTRNGMAQIAGKRCIVYPVDDKLIINYVFGFHEFQNGDLWALTGKGVYQFKKDHWEKVKLYSGFENHSCKNIIETDSGMIINYGHHLVFKKKDGTFKLIGQISYDDAQGPFFNEVYLHNQRLHVNTVDKLIEINGNDSNILFNEELREKYILHTYVDRKNRFWVYTLHDRLMVSAPGNKQNFFYKQPMKLVSAFYEDREGNIWLAGEEGLLKIKTVEYEAYERKVFPEITGNCSVIQTFDNRLLVSGANNNLLLFPEALQNKHAKYISLKQSAPHSEIIDAWCTDEQNRTWLIFREQDDLFLVENNHVKLLDGLIKRNIHQLTGVAYSSMKHKLYVCADTLQAGDENGMNNFKANNDDKYIVYPTCIHYFSNGRLLLGTRNSGFFIIDENENIYPVSKNDMPSYNTPVGIFIFDDPSGKFWIASSYGMIRYKWDQKMLPVKDLEITSKQGLPNNAVRSLAFDKFNRIWAATLSGIVVIEIDSLKKNTIIINRLSEEQGITNEYWTETRLSADANGNIWAGLHNQVLKFEPSKIKFENMLPSISIDNIQLNFKETNWSKLTDSSEGIMQTPYKPILPYNKNNLGISYKGISFSYASGLEYSYQLEGPDTNWSIPTHSEFVSFVGLPPGKYAFKVKARKSNSDWSQSRTFSFIILSPYWATWWFRTILIILAVLTIYLFYRYRIDQFKKLLAVRTKISRDLHDEIGSTLSGIGIISEVAKEQLDKSRNIDVRQSLEKINTSAGEMLEKIGDIVWAINPQNDNFEKILNRLELYAKNVAVPLGIQLYIKNEEGIKNISLDMQQRNNIYLICKEAINNAIKYSGCRQLYFESGKTDHQFHISVKDNGKGFNSEQVFEGNGLKNMKARAKEIKASLHIDSVSGKGTSVGLSLNITRL